MLNFIPKKSNFNDLPDFLKSIYKKGWKRRGEKEAIEMVYNEEFANPIDYWTYGQTILDAIEKYFREEII